MESGGSRIQKLRSRVARNSAESFKTSGDAVTPRVGARFANHTTDPINWEYPYAQRADWYPTPSLGIAVGERREWTLSSAGFERFHIAVFAEPHRRSTANPAGSARITVFIDGPTFVARFLQHVLPSGFKRIRHYGLLSPALKAERLAMARAALNVPPANAQAREDAAEFLQRVAGIDVSMCPHARPIPASIIRCRLELAQTAA